MFEACLVESTPLLRTQNRWPAIISFTAQALIVAALITIPLVHPEIVALHAPHLTILPPLRQPPPPPPTPQPIHITAAAANSVATPTPVLINAPSARPTPAFAPVENAPTVSQLGIMPGTSNTEGFSFTPASNTGPAIAVVATATASTAAAKPGPPMRISSGITSAHLIVPITPYYPSIAASIHLQGTVVIEAVISKTGLIESAHVVTGPPMLQTAAIDAVRRARYQPFLLNGQPTEVATTISINFHMN